MTKARSFILLAIAASLSACSENMVSPPAAEPEVSFGADVQGSNQNLRPGEKLKFSIYIDPSRQTYYNLGDGNTLSFPAGSLCDPGSSYGDKEWDKPCNKATSPITVNVTAWLDAKGHARVDFDQHVRFVPSNNPAQWVVITFADMEAALDPFFTILYCPTETSRCKDESKKDPTLLPVKSPLTGKITRRIKHFSGYNVAAGRDAEDSDEDAWSASLTIGRGSMVAAGKPVARAKRVERLNGAKRLQTSSGYILASG